MHRKQLERAFLELMKSGIWGRRPDSSLFTSFKPNEWHALYNMAGKQAVLGICFNPVMELPKQLQPPEELLLQWLGLHRYIEAKNLKKLEVWQSLNKEWTAAGYTPVVFKGMSIAKWYASPLSRQYSDIDIYIPEHFDQLIQHLKNSGVTCEHKPQHDSIIYQGVTIEIHSKIINIPFLPQTRCQVVNDTLGEGVEVRIPDLNTYSLVLLSHAAGHFLIPGIGYRFLCDWAVFLQHNHEKIDSDLVLKEARRMGMHRFVAEFTKLAQVQLGLQFDGLDQWTYGSDEKYLKRLSKRFFQHGDFGTVGFKEYLDKTSIFYGWMVAKDLSACRYYWPKLFWRRTPIYLVKFNILLLLRRLHLWD